MSPTSQAGLRIEHRPELPSHDAEWERLGHAAGNPFSTWEWASTWWRHFGNNRQQRILGCRTESGDLIGILPVHFASQQPLRVLRFIGYAGADQLGPICLPPHRGMTGRAFTTALADEVGWDLFVAERLDARSGWPALIGGLVTRVEPSPTIHLATADWDEYLASKSRNFRQQVRKLERRLEREYSLHYRVADDPDRLESDMDTFLSLHNARWAAAGGSSVFAGKSERFHRDLASLALANGWLRLTFLELGGIPRAASYGYRLGSADWYYQVGRDPAFERNRVGTVLLNNSVREAVRSGMSEFKLLTGEHGYKLRYATDERPLETVVLARNRGIGAALRVAVPIRRMLHSVGRSARNGAPIR